ncbi:MarR family winged helix-turn-helix transcriptional regulator [Pleomorphochaeta sp. DL1XJH-081]|jgi:DNA-binding MarR family transcriptional regulator|uniref:MarR family winged helix-turn-helix transcriptional regulator n=1 Tax=Pleomorphochaeta sp. DL1XJH-081 TaxID=3409690 RepID=UPI003BB7C72E
MYDLCDIRQIMVDLRNFEESLKKETNLSLNEALCLCQTGKGTNEPGSLAKELELSPSRLSRIIEALEQRGLIQRAMATNDRRGVALRLTPQGKTVVEQLHCTKIDIPPHMEKAIETLHQPMQTGDDK